MLRFMTGDALAMEPGLARSMFCDRAIQFRDRLGWNVEVDAVGEERDAYDAEAPLYVVWQAADGTHGGSMRFLPTLGATMVNDHFRHLVDGMWLAGADTWECSRFCLSARAGRGVAPALLLGALELGLARGLRHALGVFDLRMLRIYRRLGWMPCVLGAALPGEEAVGLGLWEFDAGLRAPMMARAGVDGAALASWRAECNAALARLSRARR